MPFERLIGAFAFLSLIPFIIIYLRRPKPTEQTVPSLMFFLADRGSTKFHSFLQQLTRNILFFIQLLILSMLAFSVMGFFIETSLENSGKTVIVLDVSGSMQADNGGMRFEQAVDRASELMDGRVSIVLASNVPRVLAENTGVAEARKILNSLEPFDTSTNLGDAILVARDIIKGKGEMIVLSDFIATEGIDPFVARGLVAQDAVVRFVNVGGEASNVGIISMRPSKSSTTVMIKNFDDVPESVKVQIVNRNSVKDEAAIELAKNSVEEFTFDTLPGQTEVRLIVDDDFSADNIAYLSIPDNAKIRTLLITNSENSNIEAALASSPDVILDIANPPVVGRFDYDVIILYDFDPELMLPGFYRDIETAVNNGSSFIITGQRDLAGADIKLLPVQLTGIGNLSRNIVNVTNYFTKDIDFGINEQYLRSRANEGTTTIVTSENSPVLALASKGQGTVVYYGIIDEYSTFKSSTSYPQFWSKLINFLAETEDLNSFNFETGRIEVISRQKVETPSGSITTDRVLFDKAGFYRYGGRVVSANMLNVRESDVSSDDAAFRAEVGKIVPQSSDLTDTKRFETELAFAALLLVVAELFFIKFRGDL